MVGPNPDAPQSSMLLGLEEQLGAAQSQLDAFDTAVAAADLEAMGTRRTETAAQLNQLAADFLGHLNAAIAAAGEWNAVSAAYNAEAGRVHSAARRWHLAQAGDPTPPQFSRPWLPLGRGGAVRSDQQAADIIREWLTKAAANIPGGTQARNISAEAFRNPHR